MNYEEGTVKFAFDGESANKQVEDIHGRPLRMFLAVNEFAVMMVLPIPGIQDGPIKYLFDAALFACLRASFLYAWGGRMQARGLEKAMSA